MAKDISAGGVIARTADGFAEQRPVGIAARGGVLPNFRDRTRMLFLGVHPTSWELVKTEDGWRLLPTLKPLFVQPGVWTRSAKKGQAPDPAFMIAKNQGAGFKVLDNVNAYLYEVDGANGTKGIFLKWERVRVYDDGAFEIVIDRAAEYAFRAALVADGVVARPRESVVSEIKARHEKGRNRAIRTKADDLKMHHEERLAGLQEALTALDGKKAAKAAS